MKENFLIFYEFPQRNTVFVCIFFFIFTLFIEYCEAFLGLCDCRNIYWLSIMVSGKQLEKNIYTYEIR